MDLRPAHEENKNLRRAQQRADKSVASSLFVAVT